ncbi:hypothetical protein MPSEU_000433900 [Mayamaea pseudoterrestris]|nr:hypothetical protein MPSEU_000433900 [Mayamaea pseudoterrestris]
MIRKGECVKTFEYLRIFPLFIENDDASWRNLPQWETVSEQMPATSCRPLTKFQAMLGQELAKSSPDFVLVAYLQICMENDTNLLPELLKSVDNDKQSTPNRLDLERDESLHSLNRTSRHWKQCRIRDQMTIYQWTRLYLWISGRIHVISVDHPMHLYASQCLPRLDANERQQVIKQLDLTPTTSMLGIMKQIQDRHPPVRLFAVLLDKPCFLRHSCIANATLEWQINQIDANKAGTISLTALYDIEFLNDLTINYIANKMDHDEVNDYEDRLRALEARTGSSCDCPKCRYQMMNEFATLDLADRLALARYYLTNGSLQVAKELYQNVLEIEPDYMDAWHALGAIELSQKNFLEAQRTWAQAIERYPKQCSQHSGMALQADKLRAYCYLDDCNSSSRFAVTNAGANKSPTISTSFQMLLPGVYVSRMLDKSICQQILAWSQCNGTMWTQNRHYAVPTYDIPVHTVPLLLKWFQTWFIHDMRSLLARQFGTSVNYFVHDAFVVKYEASSTSNYLPLHMDESTHSLVVALNDPNEYIGGGTYFAETDTTQRAALGEVLSFRGDQVLHGGEAVIKGTRYILAVFLYHDDDGNELLVNANSSAKPTGGSMKRERNETRIGNVIRESKAQKVDFSFGFTPE